MNRLDLTVTDSLLDPDSNSKNRTISYRGDPDSPNYRVFVYLTGRDLDFVERVTYKLHETFKRQFVKVDRSPHNPHCKLTIWTWGLFEVKAEVKMQDGNVIHLKHFLNYDKEIKSTPASRFVYQ